MGKSELLRRSQTRIDLLFTMSEIPHARPLGCDVRSDISRTMFRLQSARLRSSSYDAAAFACGRLAEPKLASASEGWWSQTGSNRRPPACKAGALPAELWPRKSVNLITCPQPKLRSLVGLGRLELPTSRLSSARSNQLSYKPVIRFLEMRRTGRFVAPCDARTVLETRQLGAFARDRTRRGARP